MNRPNINRPNINRPIISGGIGNQYGDNINNTFTNINQNTINNVVNRPVINRPTTINRPTIVAGGGGRYYGGGGFGGGGFYGGGAYSDPGYYPPSYPTDGYIPPPVDYGSYASYGSGYGSSWYDNSLYANSAYADYHEDWQQGAWGGLANMVVSNVLTGGIGLAAAAQPTQQTTVVYSNPYTQAPPAAPSTTTTVVVPQELDYSKPITPPEQKEVGSFDDAVVTVGMKTFEEARAAMKKGNFAEAQQLAEKAIALVPKDMAMHEFRALCQFAQKQYKEASATLYAVLNNGPGFDWNTVAGLYPDADTYGKHLKALEDAVRENPKESYLHFLLGYQYMVLDERLAALEEFKEASRLNDKDQVSKRVVAALDPPEAKDATKPKE